MVMRYIVVFVLFLGLSAHLQSQSVDSGQVKAEAEALIDTYQLTEAQEAEAYTIAERRLRNQAEIAHLQSSDHTYTCKRKTAYGKGKSFPCAAC